MSGLTRLLASNCAFLRRDGDTVHLSLDGRSDALLTRSRQDAIGKALSRHFGETLRAEIVVGAASTETPLQEQARKADEEIAAARESLESDPNVRALKDMFGATLNADSVEVVKGSPQQIRSDR